MHELSITRSIVAIACEHARGRKVLAVHLKIGALSGIDAESVRFCFDVCAEGTEVAGSKLVIEDVPGTARCRGCDKTIALDGPAVLCPCERREVLERLSGDELLVTSLEVDDV